MSTSMVRWSLSMLVIGVLGVDRNRCLVGDTYFTWRRDMTKFDAATMTWEQISTIHNIPESGTLKEMTDMKCGFNITWSNFFLNPSTTVKFVAIKVENDNSDESCTFYKKYATCVCPFFGCNSVTGVLYETLIKSLNRQIAANKTDKASGSSHRIIISTIEHLYKDSTHGKAKYDASTSQLDEFKVANAWMFPNETRKKELIQEGYRLNPTTTTTTTTEVPPTAASNSLDAAPPASEPLSTVMIGGIAAVVVLVLIAVAVAVFIILKRRKKKSNKKSGEVETKSSDNDNQKTTEVTKESESTNNASKYRDLLIRPENDLDTVNACKSEWGSTMQSAMMTRKTQIE